MIRITIDPGSVSGCVVMKNGGYKIMPFSKNTYYEIYETLSSTINGSEAQAIIEKVHAMPKQGVVSVASFMQNYGICIGMLIALHIPFKEVPPQRWMKQLPIPLKEKDETKTQWKNRLMQLAKQLVPNEKITKESADAIVMCELFDKIWIL